LVFQLGIDLLCRGHRQIEAAAAAKLGLFLLEIRVEALCNPHKLEAVFFGAGVK